MKTKKRPGTTLVEVLVAIVLFAGFMAMVSGVYRITYSAYIQNRLMAQRLYTESNMENLFSILEKEFMYQGSMGHVLGNLEGFPEDSFETSGSVATITYALAEKLVLAREHHDQYEGLNIDEGPKKKVYFAFFSASLPDFSGFSGVEDLWALDYDDFLSPTSASVFEVKRFETLTTSVGVAVEVEVAGDTPPATFVSPLQYEKVLEDGKYFKLGNKKWFGEKIYRTTFCLEGRKLRMHRYIPSVGKTISTDLLENVDDFQVSNDSDSYTVAATCSLTFPGQNTPCLRIGKHRRFFKWGE